MNSALRRLLVPLLRSVKDGKVPSFRMKSAASQALYLVQRKPSPSRKKPAQARKLANAAAHREETGAIREAVFRRAGDRCEAGWCQNPASEMDHWLNGSGRRRQKQSVETCWALCADDHRFRTRGVPTVEFWNKLFSEHCARHGYPFTPHIVHASLRPAPAAPPPPPSGERGGAGQEGPEARAQRPQEET